MENGKWALPSDPALTARLGRGRAAGDYDAHDLTSLRFPLLKQPSHLPSTAQPTQRRKATMCYSDLFLVLIAILFPPLAGEF
jgi:hypothetical protein